MFLQSLKRQGEDNVSYYWWQKSYYQWQNEADTQIKRASLDKSFCCIERREIETANCGHPQGLKDPAESWNSRT